MLVCTRGQEGVHERVHEGVQENVQEGVHEGVHVQEGGEEELGWS